MTDLRESHTAPVDLTRPEFASDVVASYRRLRVECPVSWHPMAKCWLVTRYHDASSVLRSKTLPALGILNGWIRLRDRHQWDFPTALSIISHMPFNYEGSKHSSLRNSFARSIATVVDSVGPFEARIARLLRVARADGGFDLATDFAGRLVFEIVCDLAEIPETDRIALYPLSHSSWAIESTLSIRQRESLEGTLKQSVAMLAEQVKGQVARSSTSLIGTLYAGLPEEAEDKATVVAEMICVILLMGNDALGGSLMFGVEEMLRNDGGATRPQVPQARWGNVSDEVLRFAAAVDLLLRTAPGGGTIGGISFSHGDVVATSPLAANHDPSEFGEDADTISEKRHKGVGLTFGAGGHNCVGMRMSRNIMRLALSALADLPAIQLHGKSERTPGRVVRTFDRFPVSLV